MRTYEPGKLIEVTRTYEPDKLIRTTFTVGGTGPTYIIGSTSQEYAIVDKYFCRDAYDFANQK